MSSTAALLYGLLLKGGLIPRGWNVAYKYLKYSIDRQASNVNKIWKNRFVPGYFLVPVTQTSKIIYFNNILWGIERLNALKAILKTNALGKVSNCCDIVKKRSVREM